MKNAQQNGNTWYLATIKRNFIQGRSCGMWTRKLYILPFINFNEKFTFFFVRLMPAYLFQATIKQILKKKMNIFNNLAIRCVIKKITFVICKLKVYVWQIMCYAWMTLEKLSIFIYIWFIIFISLYLLFVFSFISHLNRNYHNVGNQYDERCIMQWEKKLYEIRFLIETFFTLF